jgi:hypothetical protein
MGRITQHADLPHYALLHRFAARVRGPFESEGAVGHSQWATRYSAKRPSVPYNHALLHRFQPKP